MVDVWLPYGRTEICVRIPARNFLGAIEPKEKPAPPDAKAEVERALKEPIGAKRLSETVRPEHKVAVVVDDATRRTPSALMVLPLLAELNSAGAKDENITIIFACGIHKAVAHEEAVRLLGEEVLSRVKTISHDCKAEDLVYVGTTQKHGTKVYLNSVFAQSDVKVLTGDVCFHYFAGYSGGRISVVPGVAGEETIKHNHALLLDPNAKTGVLEGNPVHEDMVEAAKLAKVNFILNVATNSKGEIIEAFAGDLEQAFSEATALVDEMYRVTVDRRADVVVISPGGDPADKNLFQAYKGVDNALRAVKRGGVIVLAAECPEGHGNQAFCDWMAKLAELRMAEREIKRNFVLGGHKAYYLLKALQDHKIILISSIPDYYAAGLFRMKTARAINDALNLAFDIAGKNAKIWAMPYGSFTLPELKAAEELASVNSEPSKNV